MTRQSNGRHEKGINGNDTGFERKHERTAAWEDWCRTAASSTMDVEDGFERWARMRTRGDKFGLGRFLQLASTCSDTRTRYESPESGLLMNAIDITW